MWVFESLSTGKDSGRTEFVGGHVFYTRKELSMMKIIFQMLFIILSVSIPVLAQMKVVDMKGEIAVRHGVHQEWLPVNVGDILKPEDSMRSGKRSSATIAGDGTKRIVIPENVIVDLSDFRTLTQDDLVLKLAMERVLAVPTQENRNGLIIPQTTIVHGKEKTVQNEPPRSQDSGILQLNGTRVLYNAGYYGTSALKAKEVLRLYPELSNKVDVRLMIASALEKVSLVGEALTEYSSLTNGDLSRKDRAFVQERIVKLKEKN